MVFGEGCGAACWTLRHGRGRCIPHGGIYIVTVSMCSLEKGAVFPSRRGFDLSVCKTIAARAVMSE